MMSPVYGSVVSLTSMEPLLFWPALDCDGYKAVWSTLIGRECCYASVS